MRAEEQKQRVFPVSDRVRTRFFFAKTADLRFEFGQAATAFVEVLVNLGGPVLISAWRVGCLSCGDSLYRRVELCERVATLSEETDAEWLDFLWELVFEHLEGSPCLSSDQYPLAGGQQVTHQIGDRVTLTCARRTLNQNATLTVDRLHDSPLLRAFHDGRAIFTCETVGPWLIIFNAIAKVTYGAVPASPPGDVEYPQFERLSRSIFPTASASGRCVGPEEAPTVTATSTQTPLETPVATQTETAPTETPTVTPTPNRPPVVSAITATVSLPVTTYVIAVSDPDGDALTITWSGTNCGSATGATTATMQWSHGSDDCPHNTTEHADATINVAVSDAEWRVTCSYGGAGGGTGKACAEPVRSP